MKIHFLLVLCLILSLPLTADADENIPNFIALENGKIFRGGRPTEAGINQLKKLGNKTIINLQGRDKEDALYGVFAGWLQPGESTEAIIEERLKAKSLKMDFISAPISSFEGFSKKDDHLIDGILAIMNDPRNQPIFIHCEHGKDRTGLVIALYRVKYENWEIEDAYQEWIENGHGLLLLLSDSLDQYFFKKAAQIKKELSARAS